MTRAAAFLTILALVGCGTACTQETVVDLGAEITLAPGATASVSGTALTVRFVAVTEDSRCPVDVTCIWAGEVKVQLEVKVSLVASEMTLREGDSAVAGVYRVTLLRVEPRPASSGRIAARDYRATLKVEKASR